MQIKKTDETEKLLNDILILINELKKGEHIFDLKDKEQIYVLEIISLLGEDIYYLMNERPNDILVDGRFFCGSDLRLIYNKKEIN